MRLTTLRITGEDRTTAARVDKKHFTLLPHTDVGALITSGPDWAQQAATHKGEQLPLHAAETTNPPLTPRRVIRVGPNYPSRIKELKQPCPAVPPLTVTRPHTTSGPRATIPLPAQPDQGLNWGVELGVVISRHGQDIPTITALRHIAGYVIVNHLYTGNQSTDPPESRTARNRTAHSILLMGPTLVTPEQLPMGGRGLTLTATLGSRLVQRANTSDLCFDVATLIGHASTLTALQPGDLITTGTPGGTLNRPLESGRSLHSAIKGLDDIDIHFTAAQGI
ncbi:fumarylacetoacetate hydrolase family protein [Streptomyces chartreusis]|uniref:fumarylacetoacetate hydrolase family protein n=1 Tax=Streptomyces chartreusis TaxID=1969 RepID=UPI0036666911